MIKIKAIDLVSITVAAELWFKRQSEINNLFQIELKKATKLKKKLYSVHWDEDAELIIDEMPF